MKKTRIHFAPPYFNTNLTPLTVDCCVQVVSFVDVLLENTEAKKVLCIVPINTIQNWLAEFNYWLPAKVRGNTSRT